MGQGTEAQSATGAQPAAGEELAFKHRREIAGIPPGAPGMGLALSGGGIRSATFSLGLLRALARNGVLHRFDYLSTVSGGGYTGAAFGRLFNKQAPPADPVPPAPATPQPSVEQGLRDDTSLLLWWLRSNGRYLTPAGAGDLMQAWAAQLRGFLATQFEVAALIVLASALIVLPHLLGYASLNNALPLPVTFWWLAMLLPGWLGVFMGFAYWWLRDPEDVSASSVLSDLVICLLTLIPGLRLLAKGWHDAAWSLLLIALALLAAPLARIWTWLRGKALLDNPAQSRIRCTTALSTTLLCLFGLLVAGAADLLSWFLADQLAQGTLHAQIIGGTSVTALLVAVGRFALPLLQPHGKPSLGRLPLMLIANISGMVLLVLLTLLWLSALQYFIFFAQFWSLPLRWMMLIATSLLYIILTGRNLQQINRSSLHPFYRSRLARTYVSVGNSPLTGEPGHTRFPASPLSSKASGMASGIAKLSELLEGDDVALPDYAPHEHGGPIHLINCCINQTIDDRTDVYSADRKGVYLSLSSLGMEIGSSPFQPAQPGPTHPLSGTTLAEWIAISGAAAGSGMGSLTRTGLAALCFLSGFRLGYWWRNPVGTASFSWSWLGKSRAALQEMLARFPGVRSPVWYLSDGGHFDNTGVYPLLKRKLELIVLADCGADPNYVFADIENLVRKARIDLDTRIEFIDPASLSVRQVLRNCFGTPDSIMPGPGSQHLLLARISYPDGAAGYLLAVKPRLTCELPLDVAGYADRNQDFPQQSTADQFFDEAQWESYCKLGTVLGEPIDDALLHILPALVKKGIVVQANAVSSEEQKSGFSRRQRIGATIGASLSAGALVTALFAGWQAWDAHLGEVESQQKALHQDVASIQTAINSLHTELATMDSSSPYKPLHDEVYQLMRNSDGLQIEENVKMALISLSAEIGAACSKLHANDPLLNDCAQDSHGLAAIASPPSGWATLTHQYQASATTSSAWHDWMHGWRLMDQSSQMATTASPERPDSAAADSTSLTSSSSAPAPESGMVGQATAAEAPASTVLAACGRTKAPPPQRFVLYTQIYTEAQRKNIKPLLQELDGMGLTTAGIENVAVTATRAGRKPPIAWDRPVFLYSSYSEQGQACAQAMAIWLDAQPGFGKPEAAAMPIPVRLRGRSDVIEFWIPQASAIAEPTHE